jgi:uncharacterized protein YggE
MIGRMPTSHTAVVAVLVALVALASPALALAAASIVEATGEGELNLPPDEAVLSLGVTSEARTAKEALDDNAKTMAAVLGTLARAGFTGPDVTTRTVTLTPVMEYPQGGAPRIVGYRATNAVQVKTREPASIGRALDAAVGAGANVSAGLAFNLANPRAAEALALRLAVQDAERRAASMAEAVGKRLGRVVEVRAVEMERPGPRFEATTLAARAAPGPTPIEPGVITVRARATLKAELR